jgi:hypothetical protein
MVPMVIVVRIGLGLAYEGASSTPYHERDYHVSSSSAPSSGRRNNGQLSTFKAASHQEDEGLQSISLRGSSSRTKLDIVKGSDSSLRAAGDDLYGADRNSRERNGEKEGETV